MTTYRARVLTPDPTRADTPWPVRWLEDAVFTIEDGRFTRVAPYAGESIDHDLRPGVVLPGFIDGHIHLPQTRIVGSASGPLLEWLDRSTFPEEQRFADPAHARNVGSMFAAALASAGTTLSFVYSSVHPNAAHEACAALQSRGLRSILGPVLMDDASPEPLLFPADRALPALEQLVERWHDPEGRIQIAVIPRFALSCTASMMRRAGDLARKHHLWVSTHLSESVAECREAERRFTARDYLSIYEDAGLVHDRCVLAHCIHLSHQEWDRFAKAGAVVAHCPDSNAFLGSGTMPVDEVLKRQIPMVLGTDIAAGRSFRVPMTASYAYDNALRRGENLSPEALLWWATRSGATALGRPDLGAVSEGLGADFVVVDVPEWASTPADVLSWTLFFADAPLPRATFVAGQQVWDRDAHQRAGGAFPWDVRS
jgi:guanine deaminase